MFQGVKNKKPLSESEALARAAALCSAGEHCVSDIEEKLSKWGQEPEAQARIIAYLIDEKYIDESRFARAYANDKMRYAKWGKKKISMNLRMLGVSDEDRTAALDQLPQEEYEGILEDLLQAKARSVKASSNYERNGKLIRFALSRGFEMAVIMKHLPNPDEVPDIEEEETL